ncbi:MAG: 1-deoxy-D-xylulose-5-phosphate synthase [Clostridiales bacterium]|nr:1-deoxy-D-xylulose-5-phosphate synthase [Clostridiales bacterium]
MKLADIKQPDDVRNLSYEECKRLTDEIRETIISTVSRNGGHLSSNLGAVEITLALHRVFHTPEDQFVFDVGHQSYTHKLLTGRAERFDSIRCYGGLSGFPKCSESVHDCFETGHASTAISAALGLARARDLAGRRNHVVAVVGDGALTGGMCYEALNDCGNSKTRLILILNDNQMSIAKNVGALSIHLAQLRASAGWNTTKRRVKYSLLSIPLVGRPLERMVHTIKKSLKALLVDEGFFTALGFKYLGPIDGHDVRAMEKIMNRAKALDEPVVIHCVTTKGNGYRKAEKAPEQFHGTPPFLIESGEAQKRSRKLYGQVAVDELIAMAKQNRRIVAVTAAMPLGTSVNRFKAQYRDRFFDVGIAEEHAVTMCAGLAKGGMRPFFFVYSTFLQRGYDQVLHDVCMQNLPVVFLLDRAGLGNEDGQSHKGLFDIAYLRHIPNMTLLAPADAGELSEMMRSALDLNAPCAIRYPKTAVAPNASYPTRPFLVGRWRTLLSGANGTVLAVGSMVGAALSAAQRLRDEGIDLEIVNASTLKPLDGMCLGRLQTKNRPVFTLEEHVLEGGFGSAVLEYNAQHGGVLDVRPVAVEGRFISQGDHRSLLRETGLDEEALLVRFRAALAPQGAAHGR